MRFSRPLAIAALSGALVITGTTAVSAGTGGSAARSRMPASTDVGEGGEYVISFEAGNKDAAFAAVAAAGGTVVDEHDAVGLALVETGNGNFEQAVSQDAAIDGVAHNQSIGGVRQGMAPKTARERLTAMDASGGSNRGNPGRQPGRGNRADEPLESLQWDMKMIGATRDGAHRKATGDKVTVGIIDTGVDATHPDIAPNFSYALSRNFTHDRPDIDGPCDTATCIDPAWVDEGGHGTHVAGTVAAARNGIGITGVAPDATIVNVRAGQDSGYFFFYETVSALLYAGDAGLDVVNMSFYTDPWLFNCASAADYVSGVFTPEQIEEQAMIRKGVLAATAYAHAHGVTMVAAAGNGHYNKALPTRTDLTSPDYPPDTATDRVVTNNCLDLPSEAPDVITVSAVGPSGTKSDYSDYGNGNIEVAAPGGWFRDGIGTPTFRTNANEVLSSYPWKLAVEEGLVDDVTKLPIDPTLTYTSCDRRGVCGAWTYLQGTSMASPHVTGEAALVIDAHGKTRHGGKSLAPDKVARIIESTATDHACPAGGVEIYTDEGRPAEFNAVCDGTTARNGLYGEGIINATAAVSGR